MEIIFSLTVPRAEFEVGKKPGKPVISWTGLVPWRNIAVVGDKEKHISEQDPV